jgi:hypothetical protein
MVQLGGVAVRMFDEESGPISPTVYWWYRHEFHPILTMQTTSDTVHLTIPPQLEDVVRSLPD